MSEFKADLPGLFAADWREALSKVNEAKLGTVCYTPPNSDIPNYFILEDEELSFGQSVETTEFPFGGGWSNRSLNESTQSFRISGYIRNEEVLARRNQLVEALRVKTDDETPGYLDLPFWGRFKVVVQEFKVADTLNKQGEIKLSLTFVRAGTPFSDRQDTTDFRLLETATAKVMDVAISTYETALPLSKRSVTIIKSGFTSLTSKLLSLIGRVQAAKSVIDTMTASVQGTISLIDQGVTLPRTLAQSLFSSFATIASSLIGLKNDVANEPGAIIGMANNIRNILLRMFSDDFSLDLPTGSTRDIITKQATQTLYRSASCYAVGLILPEVVEERKNKIGELYTLFVALINQVERNDPVVDLALRSLRVAVAQAILAKNLAAGFTRKVPTSTSVLTLTNRLGITYDKFFLLNQSIEDQHLVRGEVSYV